MVNRKINSIIGNNNCLPLTRDNDGRYNIHLPIISSLGRLPGYSSYLSHHGAHYYNNSISMTHFPESLLLLHWDERDREREISFLSFPFCTD